MTIISFFICNYKPPVNDNLHCSLFFIPMTDPVLNLCLSDQNRTLFCRDAVPFSPVHYYWGYVSCNARSKNESVFTQLEEAFFYSKFSFACQFSVKINLIHLRALRSIIIEYFFCKIFILLHFRYNVCKRGHLGFLRRESHDRRSLFRQTAACYRRVSDLPIGQK